MPYTPNQGDIILIDFNPQSGHEQKGRRPGIVVSNSKYHKYTNMALVCPITNTISNFPLHIVLDGSTKTSGEIMCEQIKSLDYISRNAKHLESAPFHILQKTLNFIQAFY